MATTLSQIEAKARLRLIEASPRFWTSAELIDIIAAGCRDLWRDVVELKAEHYLEINNTDVYLDTEAVELSGVPSNLHKIYLIEPRDTTTSSTNPGISFEPLDYNHLDFRAARSRSATDASNVCLYYAIIGQGAPVGAPRIMVAPKLAGRLNVTLTYVPTLGPLTAESNVPIPGEADNALIAWTVAFARAKESEDRSPDANWLSVYATEKAHLLAALDTRQLQEPEFVEALFQEYWG